MNGISRKFTSMTCNLVWIGIGFGALFWILESAIHIFVFGEGNLAVQILTPRLHEIWMRLLVAGILIIFSVFAQFIINQRKRAEDELRSSIERMEIAYEQSIIYARQLNKEIDERNRAEEALKEAYDKLEQRVKERTSDLTRTAEQLELELTEHKQAEEALRESEER